MASHDLPASERVGPILCPIVVSRRPELAAIDAMLTSAREGDGRVCFLVGEPGIGKTRLSREAETRARAAGMSTFRGRAVPSTAPLPFRPLVEALGSAFADERFMTDPALERFQGPLRSMLPDGGPAVGESNRLLVFEAVTRFLGVVARDGALLLVLEDLHWADGDTLDLLEFMSDNIGDARFACLCTTRDDPGPALDLAERAAARRAATILRPGRLSAEETAEMAQASLEVADVPPTLLEMLWVRAEGVPFVIEEMLTAYVARGGAAGAATTLPHTLRELVRGRLETLDQRTRGIVAAAAVVGRRFEWSLLTAMTGLDREAVLDGLRQAVRAQIVVVEPDGMEMPFGFRHSLVREAVLAEMLPPEIAGLSSIAGRVIEDRFPGLPGEWCERAADLREAAGETTDAARHLQEAARRAVARGALASAETMLERARTLAGKDRWHVIGIDRQLVEVLSLAGKTERLREIGDIAVAFVSEKRSVMPFLTLGLGDLHLRLARGLMIAGDEATAGRYLEQARDFASRSGKKHLQARVRVFEAQGALARGDVAAAIAGATEAGGTAETLGLPDVRADASSVRGRAAFLDGDPDGALAILREAVEEAPPVSRIGAMLDLGDVEADVMDDLHTLQRARSLAVAVGAVSSQARADLLIGSALVARFELEAGAEALARCIETCERYRLALLSDAIASEAQRLAWSGSEDDAVAAIERAGPAPLTRAVLALIREERDGAWDSLSSARGDVVADALRALLSAIRGEDASAGTGAQAIAQGLRAFADAATAPPDEGPARFAAADAMLERFPGWRHMARRLTSEVALDRGWGDPTWVRESLAFFDTAGHDRMASACKALLRRAGAPVPRKGRGEANVPTLLAARGVTSREMDVLRLVGRGLGNRDIATRLFLSPRTVETHVASLMRKLDAADRGALADAASSARHGEEE